MKRIALSAMLACASPFALANTCPPMSAYSVTGVSADGIPVKQAVDMLMTGTAWKVDVLGSATDVSLSYRGVSGPLDQVLAKVVQQVGSASGIPISAISDPNRCLVTLSVVPSSSSVSGALASTVKPAASVRVLRAGENLSRALDRFVSTTGWRLRWNIDEDYVLDVDVPLPSGDVIEVVTWVVRTYQAQGGLEGVVPRFAKGNNVAVIEQMDVREDQ